MITSDLYKVKAMTGTKRDTIKLKVKTGFPLHGVKAGGVVTVEVDGKGMPFDKNWRKRVIDSKIDGCVDILKTKTNKDVK